MTNKKENVPDSAVVWEVEGCGGFCYLDPMDSGTLVCTRPGCGAKYKTDEPPEEVDHG